MWAFLYFMNVFIRSLFFPSISLDGAIHNQRPRQKGKKIAPKIKAHLSPLILIILFKICFFPPSSLSDSVWLYFCPCAFICSFFCPSFCLSDHLSFSVHVWLLISYKCISIAIFFSLFSIVSPAGWRAGYVYLILCLKVCLSVSLSLFSRGLATLEKSSSVHRSVVGLSK